MTKATTTEISVLLMSPSGLTDPVLSDLLQSTDVTRIDIHQATTATEAEEILQAQDVDVVLLDLPLQTEQGLEILPMLYEQAPHLPVIVLTDVDEEELAVKAMQRGAQDYLIKRHINRKALMRVMRYAIERKRTETLLKIERAELTRRVEERTADLSAANAELARAARMKDEFLANMSHELRTPMSAVIGLAEALQMGVYGEMNANQTKALQTIEESGHHLLSLINDILDVAKLEAGKLDIEIHLVSIEAICQSSIRLVDQIATEKYIRLETKFDPSATMIRADERSLKQILVNLLSNAIKFTPEGGRVGLEVEADLENKVAHFHIWDTGIGIAGKDMANLFKPFVQADSTLARRYGGTGLGLALVSRLTELHGGGIKVTSEVGKGSQFTVSLPNLTVGDFESLLQDEGMWETSETTTSQTPDDSDISLTLMTQGDTPLILLAEDNENNIILFRDFLNQVGYRVIVARDGLEAIEHAKDYNPQIILMDIQMPGLSGVETMRRLRSYESLQHTPILALTALAMPGDYERCMAAGATDYLSKPISLPKLHDSIETYLEKDH